MVRNFDFEFTLSREADAHVLDADGNYVRFVGLGLIALFCDYKLITGREKQVFDIAHFACLMYRLLTGREGRDDLSIGFLRDIETHEAGLIQLESLYLRIQTIDTFLDQLYQFIIMIKVQKTIQKREKFLIMLNALKHIVEYSPSLGTWLNITFLKQTLHNFFWKFIINIQMVVMAITFRFLTKGINKKFASQTDKLEIQFQINCSSCNKVSSVSCYTDQWDIISL